MSFQSMPRDVSDYPQVERCRERYYEFDGREGRVPCACSRPKGHLGEHGYGDIHELRRAAENQLYSYRRRPT